MTEQETISVSRQEYEQLRALLPIVQSYIAIRESGKATNFQVLKIFGILKEQTERTAASLTNGNN